MSGLPFSLPPKTRCDIQQFVGWANVADVDWRTWRKPEGVSMVYIFMVGAGGGGGNGVVGANSTAAGGGGGGSGGQSTLIIPAFLLPDVLYVTAGAALPAAGLASRVSIQPNATANHAVLSATGGGRGGNGSGATAGSAGSAGAAQAVSTNCLAGAGVFSFLAGQAGTAGGSTSTTSSLTYSTTGLRCSGGTGGAGLGAGGGSGSSSGAITLPASPSRFPVQAGSGTTASATVPPQNGSHGMVSFMQGLLCGIGGIGGGSTHGSASGAGLVQARGGDGVGYGCGGGGMGGALTGSATALASSGGAGYVLIAAW